ncbi:MAG: asparagine--tRNA ligase [Chloroflexota bacterium]|nr:MAG: asparagine--tRNA ligase [Chloroflexota bacterium]
MAHNVTIEQIAAHAGEAVTLHGWVADKTDKGKLQFLRVRDGTGVIQATLFHKSVSPEAFEAAKHVPQESSVIVTGEVRQEPRAPGGYELSVTDFEVVQRARGEFPITPKEHGIEFLMANRHLWLRSSRQHAILRVRATIIQAIRNWLDEQGFLLMDTPILTPAAVEGTTTLFETDFYGDPAYLTQSGQLYNEANAMAFGKVYCFGPTFRAEKSKTRRHLSEFWMVEPEWAFGTLDDYMKVAEQMVSYVVQTVLEKRAAEMEMLERDLAPLKRVVPPFPRISYDDAVKLIQTKGDANFKWGDDFGAPDETLISEQFDRPVFVYKYPTEMKAFYMAPDAERPEVCLSADLLAPEGYGEIIGGGQRSDNLEYLEAQLEKHKLPREPYEWYLDLRKYGSVPHCGFGLGIERTVAWICKLEHVRETIPFPRMLEKIYP